MEYSILLKRLEINNFRCFDQLEIDFDEKLTVFIAENGGGKTAILDALAEGLKAYLAAFKIKGFGKSGLLSGRDVRKGSRVAKIYLETEASHIWVNEFLDVEKGAIVDTDQLDSKPENVAFKVDLSKEGSSFQTDGDTSFARDAANFKFINKIVDLPVLVYYGGDSVKVNFTPNTHFESDRLDILYKDALQPERFSFTPFYNWFKGQEDRLLRLRNNGGDDLLIDHQLTVIRYAIEQVLNDDLNNPIYTNLRLNPENLAMGMDKRQFDGGTQFIEISQFSAGEKSLFSIVADLGLRLLNARADKKISTWEERRGVIRGKGIVLIDEVDLHLHPKWQAKIVGKLKEIFPDIQWVLTTHSPLLLGGISSKSVMILQNGKKYYSQDTFGREIDDILQVVMQVDAGRFTQTIRKIARFIAENMLEEAEYEIQKMQKEVDKQEENGAEHPEILRMRSLLNRKKVIGK